MATTRVIPTAPAPAPNSETRPATPQQATPAMQLSEQGRRFLRIREGVRDTYYNDDGGLCTYGVGTLVTPPRPCTPEELHTHVPAAQMDQALNREIAAAEATVRANVTVPLTQDQFDALVSLTYNAGGGAAARNNGAQPVFHAVNQQGAQAATSVILTTAVTVPVIRNGRTVAHRRSQGLVNRRHREVELFNGQWRGN